jgi:YidC/Oxa1 family membrane protein insertase
MQQAKSWIAFFVVAALIITGWFFANRWLNPASTKKNDELASGSGSRSSDDEGSGASSASGSGSASASTPGSGSGSGSASSSGTGDNKPAGSGSGSQDRPKGAGSSQRFPSLLAPPPERKHPDFPRIGAEDGYFLEVVFDTRGAGVRSLTLKQFEEADHQGKPVRNKKLELIPEADNDVTASFLMYEYPDGDEKGRPLDTLGREEWALDEDWKPDDGEGCRFRFETADFKLTKTYTLKPGAYHLGLEVGVENKKNTGNGKSFQYQLTAGHGLPIEGGWYTSTYRNSMIGLASLNPKETGELVRNFQDLKKISHQLGGEEVVPEAGKFIQYAAVAVQYFASAIVVDAEVTDDDRKRNFLERARPTVESLVLRCHVRAISGNRYFKVFGQDNEEHTFLIPDRAWHYRITEDSENPDNPLADIALGEEIIVRYRLDEDKQEVATEIIRGRGLDRLYFDDITVRVVSKPFEVKPGETITHRYLLYHGPVKVRLLADYDVKAELVNDYNRKYHLDTLTDYASPNWVSENIFRRIGWTSVLIFCTNRIHDILWYLHKVVSNYGICIILLTLIVRGLMYPLSRKQAMMGLKMQALAPEQKKLQEKHKDDRQALQLATMDLYRKHGVNPLGSCWVALLQMPIFLGLYYALQESVNLRLAPFLWIENLAAPDMLIYWTQNIPVISKPTSFGGWFYLGPFFNLLPVVAVTLMIIQQKYLMPPAQDEQQAMQQKVMKFMMIFMGLLFYKVAAGLGLYFITSSVWGFCERKLLPKKKNVLTPLPEGDIKPSLFQKALMQLESTRKSPGSQTNQSTNSSITANAPSKKKKRGKQIGTEEDRSWIQGVRDWWQELLKKAEKR